ncbi:putative oxidoreductase protein [Photobacterium angustum S14]|uniref:Propionate 3-nitronate monooxygenase n=1 Tax=Photobacterium angustum (strain S14 / CCUG 15956) TaxID=314292 RepID=Q1ZWL7_PHOAS|nr:putative oxidoreductase protein [Photobacterium angustum S14]
MTSNLNQLLGTKLNIIQAPMAGVQNWELAVAVSEAGGLGSIPCGMLTPEKVVDEIERFKAHSDKRYNLNFFCHEMEPIDQGSLKNWQSLLQGYYRDLEVESPNGLQGLRYPYDSKMADCIERFKPPVISFHFGLPSQELIKRIKSWGTVILSSATTLEEAIWLEMHGADIIIA